MAEKLVVKTGSRSYEVLIRSFDGAKAELVIDGKTFEVTAESVQSPSPTPQQPYTQTHVAQSPSAAAGPKEPGAPSGKVLVAQMPGTVLKLTVEPGQEVKAGQVLLVLEAMKMENEIRSDRNGRVSRLLVEAGQQVQTGQGLVEFE